MQNELFATALNIEAPFYIKEIDFNPELKRLDIHIDFKRGSVFPYINDGMTEDCKAFDTKEKQWRHLNL